MCVCVCVYLFLYFSYLNFFSFLFLVLSVFYSFFYIIVLNTFITKRLLRHLFLPIELFNIKKNNETLIYSIKFIVLHKNIIRDIFI